MPDTIQSIYNEFHAVYDNSLQMISTSNIFVQNQLRHNDMLYSDTMHMVIVEQCFMRIFLAWENFLEKSFIIYLLNGTDLQSNLLSKFASPIDKEHAYNMIKGAKLYPDWTNIEEVKKLSSIYFENSGHFAILISPPPDFLDIKQIRNRISHISEKSIKGFDKILSKNISQVGISPGQYLMMFKETNTTYLTFYCEMLKGYVDAICNSVIP